MHIVPFDNHDSEAIIRLITSIQIDEFDLATTVDQQPDLKMIPAYYQFDGGNFWLAFDEGKLIGTLAVKNCGNGIFALRKMFVTAEHRGKTKGVAAALLAALLEWVRERGGKDIYLGTVNVYLAAHRFYEKNGFVQVSRDVIPETVPLMDVDRKYYRLTLEK